MQRSQYKGERSSSWVTNYIGIGLHRQSQTMQAMKLHPIHIFLAQNFVHNCGTTSSPLNVIN